MAAGQGNRLVKSSGIRLMLIALGGVSLIAGLLAALSLVGLPQFVPVGIPQLPSLHGPAMVFGFVTTLIALERAVALRELWAFASPVLTGVGGILLLTSLPLQVGLGLQTAGVALMVVIYWRLWRRLPSVPVGIEWLGAVMALGAGLLWLGGVGTPAAMPWIVGYLVLTIAGERLELSQVSSPPPSAPRLLLGLAGLLAVAAPLSLILPRGGNELVAAALLGIALWLFRFDVARTLVRGSGLPRFSAANMMAGAAWLAVASVAWLLTGPLAGAKTMDVVVHAITLGYVMAMIFAHAPIIFPAILRRPMPYHWVFWIPTALLHAGLAVRIVADLQNWARAWQVAGVGGVLAILVFMVTVVWRVGSAGRETRSSGDTR